MSKTRAERLKAFERWADRVTPEELQDADPEIARKVLEALDATADAGEATATARESQAQ